MTHRTALASVAVAVMAATAVPHGRAQESGAFWVPEEKARIGVLLEARCEVTTIAGRRCDLPPVVTSVVVNGPADRAGIAAGDTLLSIDGMSVTSTAGREALLNLEAGATVELSIARGTAQLTIPVTPEMRAAEPYVDVRTTFFGPGPEAPEVEQRAVDVRVVRIPSVRSRIGEVEVRLDSLRTRSDAFVFFHQDSVGGFKIEIGDRARAELLLRQLREEDRSAVVRIGEPGTEDPEDHLTITVDGVRAQIPGYVWEHQELAQRLVKVRDSALRTARVHLDSLVHLRERVPALRAESLDRAATAETGPAESWAYFVGPRRVPEQLRSLFLSHLRIAGAEFRELSPDLADYFEGADAGLLVMRVLPGTPAAGAGLREGDVLVEVNGEKCHRIATLREAVDGADPSVDLQVVWIRKGSRQTGRLPVN